MCRRPQCTEGDICNKDKDCGRYFHVTPGMWHSTPAYVRGTCEKTITDRSEGDLWLYTDMK